MSRRNFLRGDKRFWSPIAITSGLVIFFFGLGVIPVNAVNGYIDVAAGIVLLVVGFLTAPYRTEPIKDKEHQQSAGEDTSKPPTIDYQTYLSERNSLVNALREQSQGFDKYVLTLAAGSFGLSLLFIRQLVPEPIPDTLKLLISAWGTFGTSILFTLLSFLISQFACLKQIQILGQGLKKASKNSSQQTNLFTIVTHSFNWLSMGLFIAGVVLLIVFVAQNLLFTGG